MEQAPDIDTLLTRAADEIRAAATEAELEAVRVRVLGRSGPIRAMEQEIPKLAPEQRKPYAQSINTAKQALTRQYEDRKAALVELSLAQRLAAETLDLSLPARPETTGRLHPISQTIDEVIAIFGEMGFMLAEGPDIEDDFHNFTALNFPEGHPAREMHDTFYLPADPDGARMLLRTHTSPVQVRTMQKTVPPIRIIAPGRTFRSDSDQTHTPMFHQVEGLVIDEKTHMGHLKGCLAEFAQAYFEVDHVPIRFRPSFFPFTEPSAEVDIGCSRKGGELKIGAGDDWLEILGSGMVHPNVLRHCGIDPDRYQGFAFGMGIERIAMLKYGIPDLRTFFDADLRWLKHYGFVPLDIPSLITGLAR